MQEGTVLVPEGSASGLLGDAVLAAQLGGHPIPSSYSTWVLQHSCPRLGDRLQRWKQGILISRSDLEPTTAALEKPAVT